jgi:predicted N-acyltransferase
MRQLGSLSYPYSFFRKAVEKTPQHHLVSLATWNGKPIAGLLSFVFKDRIMPYFLGTCVEARRCSAANYIYLCLMEWAVEKGIRVFDFGRSRVGNTGSFDFKRFQGFTPTPLFYQTHVPAGQTPPKLSPADARYRLARKVWPHLPLWLTKSFGARLAAHFPG